MHMNCNVRLFYDSIGEQYKTPVHKTVTFFAMTQRGELMSSIERIARRMKRAPSEMEVLNIGTGNGEQRETLCYYMRSLRGYGIDPRKMVDLDLSMKMLKSARRRFPILDYGDEVYTAPKQLQADAAHIPIEDESLDVVLAALCDHIEPQGAFFAEANRVLRKNGCLITTYPAKALSRVIRRDIYGIDESTTRFVHEGSVFEIPSFTPSTKELRELFSSAGFCVELCKLLYAADGHGSSFLDNFGHYGPYMAENGKPSTIRCAQRIMGLESAGEIPVIALGVGIK